MFSPFRASLSTHSVFGKNTKSEMNTGSVKQVVAHAIKNIASKPFILLDQLGLDRLWKLAS